MARLAVDGPAACVAVSYYRSDALSFEVRGAAEDQRSALAAIEARAAWSPADFETGTDVDLGDVESVRLVGQELALLNAGDLEAGTGSEVGGGR